MPYFAWHKAIIPSQSSPAENYIMSHSAPKPTPDNSPETAEKKLWGGRFSQATSGVMERFSESVSIDHRLYKQDIQGSIAHATMLARQDIISRQDGELIVQGLESILAEIEQQTFSWSVALEDVHMNIEAALTERIGEAGKRLHTARSRNDQVATDMRLFVRASLDNIADGLSALQTAILQRADEHSDAIMPGFTHLQPAQPITLGHHLLAWNEMLQRDYERFCDCRKRVNISPLGSAALAGTGFPIDREFTARALGFDAVSCNSLDAVSDRDFVLEFVSAAAICLSHFSRIAEEMVIWSSAAFNFVDLGDEFCTGSSIMPNKKNPDVAEITRGKSARVIGNLVALLTLMKAQPLAYNRDNQEDKAPLFDSVDTLELCLEVFIAMMPGITFNTERMLETATQGYTTATDLADYLVKKGLPFRDAHSVVGQAVGYAEAKGLPLHKLALAQLQCFDDRIADDVYDVLQLQGSVCSRDHVGGTAPARVRAAIICARKLLNAR